MQVFAIHLGRHIPIEEAARIHVDRIVDKSKSDLCLKLGGGWVYLFAFGSVVFTEVEEQQRDVFLGELRKLVKNPAEAVTENYRIVIDSEQPDKVHFDFISLNQTSPERIRLVSLVVAQSVTLENYEIVVNQLLEQSSHYTDALATGSKHSAEPEMLKFIGVGLATRREIISNMAILDTPDIAWEDPHLDVLAQDLRSSFELTSRYRTLEHKLRLIHETLEILVDLRHTRRSFWLEIIITVLIAVELILALVRHS